MTSPPSPEVGDLKAIGKLLAQLITDRDEARDLACRLEEELSRAESHIPHASPYWQEDRRASPRMR